MQKTFITLLCLCLLYGCKKDSPSLPKTVNLTYSLSHGYGMILSLKVVNQKGIVLFDNANITTDGSANLPVSPGDVITASYNSNIVNEIENNNFATITLKYAANIISEAQGSVTKSPTDYTLILDVPK